MKRMLTVATAGVKSDQLADMSHLVYPRVDYLELQRRLDMDVIDYRLYAQSRLGAVFRRLETQLRSDPYLALLALQRRQDGQLLFALSERVGIPLAIMRKVGLAGGRAVTRFTAWSQRQERLITRLKLFDAMGIIIVDCNSLKDRFVKLGVAPDRVRVVLYSVDQQFFAPLADMHPQPGNLFSLGEMRGRDYATLLRAVDGLPVQLTLAAGGSWYAREKKAWVDFDLPANVSISSRLSALDLRQVYARSQIVVIPLYDKPFSAGITAILEAMSMGRAVITSRSRGVQDYIVDGETGVMVDCGDVDALRIAIDELIADPARARRLGEAGRARVEAHLNLDRYVDELADVLRVNL